MVRWRLSLLLALLLLLPTRMTSKSDKQEDDDEEETSSGHGDETEEDDEEEDDEEEEQEDKATDQQTIRRYQASGPKVKLSHPTTTSLGRTPKRRPLECFVCAYKAETPLRACLDPTKFRVHTITCHGLADKCFTSVISHGATYEAVVRGCRSGCVGSPDTTCCEINRCNNQAFSMPVHLAQQQQATMTVMEPNKVPKTIPPSIFFFVTILLLLQTVVKVTI